MFLPTLNKVAARGIKDKHGHSITVNSLSEFMKHRLINHTALGLFKVCYVPNSAPFSSMLTSDLDTNILKVVLHTIYQIDDDSFSKMTESSGPGKNIISTDSDEARTQVITRWMQTLEITDANFLSLLSVCGFLDLWDQAVKGFIAGTLTGMARSNRSMAKEKCKKEVIALPEHMKPYFQDLIRRLETQTHPFTNEASAVLGKLYDENWVGRTSCAVGEKREIPEELFSTVCFQDSRYKISLQFAPGTSMLEFILSGVYTTCDELLSPEEKHIFSRWAGLPERVWGHQHRKEFAVTEIHYLIEAKTNNYPLPEKLSGISELMPKEKLPPLVRPLTNEIITIFAEKYNREQDDPF